MATAPQSSAGVCAVFSQKGKKPLPVFSSFSRNMFHNNSDFHLVGLKDGMFQTGLSRNVREKTIDGNLKWGNPWL